MSKESLPPRKGIVNTFLKTEFALNAPWVTGKLSSRLYNKVYGEGATVEEARNVTPEQKMEIRRRRYLLSENEPIFQDPAYIEPTILTEETHPHAIEFQFSYLVDEDKKVAKDQATQTPKYESPTKLQGPNGLDILTPLEPAAKKGWTLEVNGAMVPDVSYFILNNESMNVKVSYGLHPSKKYDSFAYKEPMGGGSLTIPYFYKGKELYVGVLIEYRPYTGGFDINNIRGFVDPGDNHEDSQIKETTEESGFNPKDGLEKRRFKLGGIPMNFNSTFNITNGKCPDGKKEGLRAYGLVVHEDEVQLLDKKINDLNMLDDEYRGILGDVDIYEFKPEYLIKPDNEKNKATGEKIERAIFIPVDKAKKLHDMFTVAGAGRLESTLKEQKKLASHTSKST